MPVNHYRSGLEERVAAELSKQGQLFSYEASVIRYTKPQSNHRYTPDFQLANGIIVETKGRFVAADRKKHLLIKEQNPELDIRFVFSNPNTKIAKGSKTSYADWCDKHGFKYAARSIPKQWLDE